MKEVISNAVNYNIKYTKQQRYPF